MLDIIGSANSGDNLLDSIHSAMRDENPAVTAAALSGGLAGTYGGAL